jgi:DNA-binding transcriptional LysR family regulator
MSDLNLRRLRYFVVVAEELSYGRAAERLHIAQPVLSRQITVLEQELGVVLLDRSTRGTALSSAGEALLAEAKGLLSSATALERRARIAARGVQRFSIGFMPGLIVTPMVQALNHQFPGLQVDVVRTSWDDQVEMIHDGRIDISVVRLPVATRGLATEPLFTEARVVALAASHPLAAQETVAIADLAPVDLLQDADAVPEWRDARLQLALPLPGEQGGMPIVHAVEEKLEQVAAGRGIVILPKSTARLYTRPDVAYRPVDGLAPGEVALAWEAGRSTLPLRFAIENADTLRVSPRAEVVLDG